MTDRELFEFIDVQEMLTEMGIQRVRDTHSGEVQYSCPFPGHSHLDSRPSASMATVERDIPDRPGETYPKTSFYCFGCGAKGSAITFLAEYEGVSPVVAKRWLRERFAAEYLDSAGGSISDAIRSLLETKFTQPPSRKPLQIIDEIVVEEFEIDWDAVDDFYDRTQPFEGTAIEPAVYMLNRGFTAKTLSDFKVGFDDISGRLVIPVRNTDGFVVGLKGRAWWDGADPKYMILGGEEYGFETYSVSRVLFGLDIAKVFVDEKTPLIVREGELNAMMLHQLGHKNATGFSGRVLSHIQIGLIKRHADRVLLWFDNPDDAWKAAESLDRDMIVSIVNDSYPDPVDDPDGVQAALDSAQSSLLLKVSR